MATTEERLRALELAVTKLAANKADIVSLQQLIDLNVARYVDLHTAYIALVNDVNSLQLWITNHQTGNAI